MKSPSRHWYQYTLRALLLLVTATACLLLAWRVCVQPWRDQQRVMALVEKLGGTYQSVESGPGWLRGLLGADEFQDITHIDLADCDTPEAYVAAVSRLPKLETLFVGGLQITDKEVASFRRLASHQVLVLDSTRVSDAAIAELRAARPNLRIHKSDRRAIVALRKQKGSEITAAFTRDHRHRARASDACPEIATQVSFAKCSLPVTDEHLRLVGVLDRVRALVLAENHLQNEVSDQGVAHLADLRELECLKLNGAAVTDASLASLKNLTKLKFLDLSNSSVTGAGLQHLAGNTELAVLCLMNSKLDDQGAAHLAQFRKLRVLDLEGTRITDEAIPAIGRLHDLVFLNLDGTDVAGTRLSELKGCKQLLSLWLAGTKLDDRAGEPISNLHSLKILSLNRTNFSDLGLSWLQNLRLDTLCLDQTSVTDEGLELLEKMPLATQLSLAGTGITDEGLRRLAEHLLELKGRFSRGSWDSWSSQLPLGEIYDKPWRGMIRSGIDKRLLLGPHAPMLSFAGTKITDAGLVYLDIFPDATHLDLSNTAIGDSGPVHLTALRGLSWLNLSNTQVSDAGLLDLRTITSLRHVKVRGTRTTKEGAAELRARSRQYVVEE
jgi:Leucine-rich repeat (LRR) protein